MAQKSSEDMMDLEVGEANQPSPPLYSAVTFPSCGVLCGMITLVCLTAALRVGRGIGLSFLSGVAGMTCFPVCLLLVRVAKMSV